MQSIRDQGKNPYPHKFDRTHRIDEFRAAFETVATENGVFLEGTNVLLTGRVITIRSAGPKLVFIDIQGDDAKVQVMATAANYVGDFD